MAASDDPRLFARVGKMASKPSTKTVVNPLTGDVTSVTTAPPPPEDHSHDPIFGQPVRPKTPRRKASAADVSAAAAISPPQPESDRSLVSPRGRRQSQDHGNYDPFGAEKPAGAKKVGKTDPSKFLFDPSAAATGTNIVSGMSAAEHKQSQMASRPPPDPAVLSPRRELVSPRTRGAYNPVTNQDDPIPALARPSSKGAFAASAIDKDASSANPITFADSPSSAAKPKKVAKANPENFLYDSNVSASSVIFGSDSAPAAAAAVPRSSSKGAFNQTVDKDASGVSPITFAPTGSTNKRVAKANPENFLYDSDASSFNIVSGQAHS